MLLLPEVLLLMWTTNIDMTMRVELFELFAGEAKVSQAFREEGISYVSYDCIYDPTGRSMNFLSSGGFAFRAQLVAQDAYQLKYMHVCMLWLYSPRLAMACVMREIPNSMNVLAPPCASWSLVSRGTSDRSPINPDGRASTGFVHAGNMTIARCGICGLSVCATVAASMLHV